MMLRPRQKLFVKRSLRALGEHGNTLGVAPTGAGKTVMLSAAVGEHIGSGSGKAAVLAHRDELTAQNLAKFRRVNPGITTSVVDAVLKSWAGQVTFAMVPTLTRQANLGAMPALDLLVIDEAHHAVADSYLCTIDQARQRNPNCRIYGVTATPNRGDKIGLRQVFSNVADQIRLGELIASGHLVPPRTFIIDVGVQDELRAVRRSGDDFDMGADYHQQFEAMLYGWRQGSHHYWCGARDQGNVWHFDKPARNDLHPTMKPVALVERAIRNSSKPRDTVLDCFGGSGTTMIAAERTGRRAVLLEIDPAYADVIVRRWQDTTGEAAVLEGDDRIFADVAAARGIVDHDVIQNAKS